MLIIFIIIGWYFLDKILDYCVLSYVNNYAPSYKRWGLYLYSRKKQTYKSIYLILVQRYLLWGIPFAFSSLLYPFLAFQTADDYLPVEVGYWNGIPHAERTCPICGLSTFADQFHFRFKCNAYVSSRYFPSNYMYY